MDLLELDGVTVRLGGVTVLDRVSGRLEPGLTLLLGPNGAGKTTLLRVLASILAPQGGEVRWQGRPVAQDLAAYRRRLGYLPQRQAVYPEMRVGEYLTYLGSLKAIPPDLALARRTELLAGLGLAGATEEPLSRLSQGERQLVGLAQALLNDPAVLLLDEPLEGLDHDARHRVLGLLSRPGRIILMATHRTELTPPGAVAVWKLAGGRNDSEMR
ncbi:MAG: ATP-binding cassette domain-containing protein [Bacillota bacterium]